VRDTELGYTVPSRFQPFEAEPRPLSGAFRLTAAPADLFATQSIYFTRGDCDQDRPV
jgi:hypothetical protein